MVTAQKPTLKYKGSMLRRHTSEINQPHLRLPEKQMNADEGEQNNIVSRKNGQREESVVSESERNSSVVGSKKKQKNSVVGKKKELKGSVAGESVVSARQKRRQKGALNGRLNGSTVVSGQKRIGPTLAVHMYGFRFSHIKALHSWR